MGLSQALFFLLAGSPAMIADGHKAHPYGGGRGAGKQPDCAGVIAERNF